MTAFNGALTANLEHVRVDIADDDTSAAAASGGNPKRNVASAARDIKHCERARVPRRIDRSHQRVLPGAMQAARHQIVHQIVAASDRRENVVHQRLLLRQRHGAVAEMGVTIAGHQGGFPETR